MTPETPLRRLFLSALLLLASHAVRAEGAPPEGRLLRFPDARGDVVVFVYAGDVWRAPLAGGVATRLTSGEGTEMFPKLSPDGKWIAFSAEYTGTRQVYVMPAWGGSPRQLTFYNDVGPLPPRGGWDDWVLGWTRDGKILVRMNRTPWGERMGRYYVVDPAGGLERPLALPEGGSASLSPDGTKIAYTPVCREFRTWKRTMGGRAQDVWTYDFEKNRSERLTDWKGTDNFPMWYGETIYFTSDRDRTLNLYALDRKTRAVRKVTDFQEYDVLWPSLGDRAIVFMNGGYLFRLDLPDEKVSRIPITLAADFPAAVPHFVDVAGNLASFDLSPSAARVVAEARGEIFTVPAKEGAIRNLTGTQGVREISPAWSPDGSTIAYLSDATGEYEIWVRPQDGSGEPRRLTTDGAPWKFPPAFSPDGKKIAYGDKARRLRILDVATGAPEEVDRGRTGDLDTYRWSPDSRFLVYETSHPSGLPCLAVYSVEEKKATLLGDGTTADSSPAFSADGKLLFFLSNRDYNLRFSSFEFNFVYDRAGRVYATTLEPGIPSPFPTRSDEEKGAKEKGEEKKKSEPPEVRVVPDGWASRTVALPGLEPGSYAALVAVPGAVFYLKGDGNGPRALFRYDLDERKEEKVVEPCASYALTADGKKLVYRQRNDLFLVDAKPGAKPGDGKLDLSSLRVKLDPKAEWSQTFDDAWRIVRDWFYDPNLHGVDWPKMRERYGALVPFVAHRGDLDFLFGEMIGELESGHTYVASGDEPRPTRISGGMLGAELEADPSGRYRLAKIYAGENWDPEWRSPLTEPGLGVRAGQFVLAIDGADLRTSDNPYRFLEGKASVPVALRIADSADGKGARTVLVRPIESEQNLRYLDWVRSRMELADRLSGGKVGYIHLPNTAVEGNRMLQKLFYSQVRKPALIVDDRYNGGGFIPDRMIEYLSRRTLSFWAQRGVESFRTPGFAHDGPKAMLVNGYSSSGGDALPYYFRLAGLGPIVGTRTWGGLIGLSGNPALEDGGSVLVPTFRIYDASGKWVVEDEGVSPDVEVVDLPEARLAGGDPSLEKGVEILLHELEGHPRPEPKRPTPPDKTP